ncbi:MAG: hypothetical protein A2991_03930 [Candidatus Terrybacteria bacterium RIFCSPLOWO2_01_FULL_58_14]|uniref:Prepilin type IV endopeptidase peptidase domain-containing protein n=2 Tax=Candidatus Terryibacteriota TaxID=1817920 RepID=A0A1G2PYW2_9BACT|nr:MAG: hypothetical protein A2682_03325 [Candidatus Terrybacteria bacterium RIFCSPHIGHO2_01_FULL_58_15]OHA53517.1 MAG: hypothetical protein A2991_03930 [Candidatus Terrybacteria bacterium RIFCSPLOWO2_01_FULL_58_14]
MEIPTVFFIARLIVLASGLLLGASFVLGDASSPAITGRMRKFSHPLLGGAFLLVAVLIVGEPTTFSWWQYQAWAADPRSQLLLPPTAPISYFLSYVFLHFWVWRILGGIIALAFFLLADRFIIRPSQGFRMNRREAALIAFGMMLSGWPYLLVYFSAVLLLYVFILVGMRMVPRFRKTGEARFPVALPATLALLIIPWAHDIIVALGLTVLRVTVLSV